MKRKRLIYRSKIKLKVDTLDLIPHFAAEDFYSSLFIVLLVFGITLDFQYIYLLRFSPLAPHQNRISVSLALLL